MAFPNNCNPRVLNVEASNGCSLTRASIQGMTPQDFEDQGFKEVGMDKIIANAQEARLAGYKENTLEMLLMSRLTPIKGALNKTSISSSQSVILPFIYRQQERNINSNYWEVVTGSATPTAGTSGIPASAWDLILKNPSSTYSTALVDLERYFLPGQYILVENVTAGSVAQSIQFKIIASVNSNSGGIERCTLTLEPNVASATWNGYSAAQKLPFQPAVGLAIGLSNSVSDYESWGENEVAENKKKLLTYWCQTSRETHEYNDEYLRALNASLTSGYFKNFRQLPLAKQKVLQHQQYIKKWLNAVWYGQRINDLQEVETYTSLPEVVDPANTSCTLEYKANALGFETQLNDCSRLLDRQGAVLQMDTVFSTGYDLKRAREASGGTVDRIDWITDRHTAGLILTLMIKFYQQKYSFTTERMFNMNQKLEFDGQTYLNYNTYEIPADLGGYEMGIAWHSYFDDKIAAAPAGQKDRQRCMWAIDWSDVQIGIAGTSRVTRQTNVADELYKYVIKPNISRVELQSQTWTAILEDPNRHYMMRNFSDSCPTATALACAAT